MKKHSNHGFAALELIGIIVLVSAIAGAGYYAYTLHSRPTKTSSTQGAAMSSGREYTIAVPSSMKADTAFKGSTGFPVSARYVSTDPHNFFFINVYEVPAGESDGDLVSTIADLEISLYGTDFAPEGGGYVAVKGAKDKGYAESGDTGQSTYAQVMGVKTSKGGYVIILASYIKSQQSTYKPQADSIISSLTVK